MGRAAAIESRLDGESDYREAGFPEETAGDLRYFGRPGADRGFEEDFHDFQETKYYLYKLYI